MNKIFIGYLLSFFEYNFEIGGLNVGIFPAFISLAIMTWGIWELSGENEYFRKGAWVGMALVIVQLGTYVLNLLHLTGDSLPLLLLLSVPELILNLWVVYLVVRGIMDMEHARQVELNGEPLLQSWKRYVCAMPVVWAVAFFLTTPFARGVLSYVVVSIALLVAIVAIAFLATLMMDLNQSRKKYNQIYHV